MDQEEEDRSEKNTQWNCLYHRFAGAEGANRWQILLHELMKRWRMPSKPMTPRCHQRINPRRLRNRGASAATAFSIVCCLLLGKAEGESGGRWRGSAAGQVPTTVSASWIRNQGHRWE